MSVLVDQFGGPLRRDLTDVAWQPPADPLAKGAAERAVGTIHREIPLSVVITGWDVPSARAAKRDLVIGLFEQPAQMVDAIILTDSRVQAGLASRLSILGRPVRFRVPRKYRDSALAKECLQAFVDAWPEMAPEASIGEVQRWNIMMGFGLAQILWDTTGEYAIPHPLPWHPRYSYFHWLYRCYVAITLDGQEPIIPGNGSWILHTSNVGGDNANVGYRSWMRGAVGAISPWWLGRSYALRDWMRWSEKHGLPILRLKTPAVGDPYQQAIVRFSMANIGQEALIHLPQNPPPALSYDVDLLEAKGSDAHEGFRKLIAQCNEEITLSLNGQTLTTSMPAEGGSSYAAARIHASVLQGILEADASALARTIHRQLARPFAAVNFGNPDLAPLIEWNVEPYEDAETKAKAALSVAQTLVALRTAGYKVPVRDVRRLYKSTIPGFDIGRIEEIEPMQIEAQAARAGASVEGSGSPAKPDVEADEKANLGRLSRLMARLDPAVVRLLGKRSEAQRTSFVTGEDDGLCEAMADARRVT